MLTIALPLSMLLQSVPVADEPKPRPAIATALATARIIRAAPVELPRADRPTATPQGATVTRSPTRVMVEFY